MRCHSAGQMCSSNSAWRISKSSSAAGASSLGVPRQEEVVLRPDIGAGQVDDVGHAAGNGRGTGEDEAVALARLDRNAQARHRRDALCARAGGVDERPAGNGLAGPQRHLCHAVAGERQTRHLVVRVFDPGALGRPAEAVEKSHGIEPAFFPCAEGGTAEVLDVHIREALTDTVRVEEDRVRAEAPLHLHARLGRVHALRRAAVEVAVFLEAEVRRGFVRIERRRPLGEVPDDLDPELADLHVDRVRVLLADRARRQGRGGEGVGGIAFDDEDGETLFVRLREPVGARRADGGAADDDNVVGCAPGRSVGGQAHGTAPVGPLRHDPSASRLRRRMRGGQALVAATFEAAAVDRPFPPRYRRCTLRLAWGTIER